MSAEQGSNTLWRWILGSAFLASLCCFVSVLLVGIGLVTVSVGNELSNNLYFGPARWIFYAISLFILGIGLYRHFNNQGICTLEHAKRERNRIVNTTILVLITTFAIYFVWNYIVLELAGIAVGLPWEDSAFWR